LQRYHRNGEASWVPGKETQTRERKVAERGKCGLQLGWRGASPRRRRNANNTSWRGWTSQNDLTIQLWKLRGGDASKETRQTEEVGGLGEAGASRTDPNKTHRLGRCLIIGTIVSRVREGGKKTLLGPKDQTNRGRCSSHSSTEEK